MQRITITIKTPTPKVYIAGPITGVKGYKRRFIKLEKKLRKLGYSVMNPARLNPGFKHKEYMHICYAMVDVCDVVVLLKDWQFSEGAKLEYKYAKEHNKKIIFEK